MEKLKLHNYQERAINYVLENKAVHLMIDMGLGKTAIALKVIEAIKIPTVVFAPLTVCYTTWPEEIKQWTPDLTYTILHGKDKDKRINTRRNLYLINYEGVKWLHAKFSRAKKIFKFALVLDESTFLKSASTKRFKMLKSMYPLFSNYRMCLSAKPTNNGLHELWPQVYMLDGGERLGKTYSGFRDLHFNYTGPPRFRTWIRAGHAPVIHEKIKGCTFRLDKKDYLKMPKLTYNSIMLRMPPNLMALYNKTKKDSCLTYGRHEIEIRSAEGMANKLRQLLQGGFYTGEGDGKYELVHTIKADALKNLVDNSGGNPILCPINFRFERDIINKVMGYHVPCIAGGTTREQAVTLIKTWQDGALPLLLCHPLSMSHGVNLQAGGHMVVWFGLSWSLEQYHQLNGRIHRQGQRHDVTIHHLLFKGTIDEVVMAALRNKDRSQQQLLDVLRLYTEHKLTT